MLPIVVIVAAAGAVYYFAKRRQPFAPGLIPFVRPNNPPHKIHAASTASEGSTKIEVLESAYQPRLPSTEAQMRAFELAKQLEAALRSNPAKHCYMGASGGYECTDATKNQHLIDLIKQFQLAVGLAADGLYGPYTAGALMFYLDNVVPPAPYFYFGSRHLKAFRPRP